MANIMEFSQKIMELSYDPSIPLLHTWPKEKKSVCHRDTCIPVFIAAPFKEAKTQNQMSVHQWKTDK